MKGCLYRGMQWACTLLLLVISYGCAQSSFLGLGENKERPKAERYPTSSSDTRQIPKPAESYFGQRPEKLPWQSWVEHRDLAGQPITNMALLEGDELFALGHYRNALIKYHQARTPTAPRSEQDALILREAAARLALNSPEKTLRILSDYFRESGRAEESVTAPFSLLFAFAYGVRGDIDQSLAWFSRTNRIHAGVGGFSEAASSGLRALLRVPSQNDLMLIGERWASDSFVSLLIGQELRRRNLEPAPYEHDNSEDPARYARFWQIGIHSPDNRLEQPGAGKTVLGVILPLSGKQAALGEKVKNGIELAFLGQGAEQDFVIDVRDSRGEPLAAMSAYRSLVNADVPTVVLGPLLSEPSEAVARVAERSELPVLVFSKKSTFETGENIFRLGPTLQSQIRALLEKVIPLRGVRKIAIAVPVGAVGDFYREIFLREVAKHDAQVIYQARYLPGNDTELVAMSAELELVEADALFFPGSLKEASRLVANFSQQTRDRLALLGLGTWDNPRELQKSRSVMNGAMFVSPFNTRSERDVVQSFQEAYERKFGVAPDFLAAQGFDAATLAISAYRQAKQEQLSYSDGLRSIEQYNGLTGRISVENTGELQRDFEVLELRDGQLATLEIAESSLVVTPSYVLDELSSELPPDTLGEFR